MDDISLLQEKIELLEERVAHLEAILNGSIKGKAGRKNKLNVDQQYEIIQKHNQGVPYSVLAEEYHVSKGTISKICKGRQNDMIIPVYRKRSDTLK